MHIEMHGRSYVYSDIGCKLDIHLLYFHILGQEQVQYDGYQEYHGNNISCKNRLNYFGENMPKINLTCGCKSDSYSQRQRGNRNISLCKTGTRKHFDTGYHNGTKHHNCTSAENRVWQRCEEIADRRQKTCQNHTSCASCDGKTIHNLCHVDQSDILREGCYRRTTKQARNRGRKAITSQRTGNLLGSDLPV